MTPTPVTFDTHRMESDYFNPVKATPQYLISLKRSGESIILKPATVRARMAGQYQSKFKGRGMEFDEVRPYQPGDDIRNIDWRVTARTGKTHTKLFREERERPVFLWLDLSGSMHFGTRRVFKAVAAAEVAAMIGWSAVNQNDRIGGMIYSPNDRVLIRPGRGKSAVTSMINQICNHQSWESTPELHVGPPKDHFSAFSSLIRPGSMVVLISDFRTMSNPDRDALSRMAVHSEIVMMHLHDPLEKELPPPGDYSVQHDDATFILNTRSDASREQYHNRFDERVADLGNLCRTSGAHYMSIDTAVNPDEQLPQLFRRRR